MTYEQDWLNIYKDKLQQRDTHFQAINEIEKQLAELTNNMPENLNLFGMYATHPKHGECLITSKYPDLEGDIKIIINNNQADDGTSTLWVKPTDLTIKDEKC